MASANVAERLVDVPTPHGGAACANERLIDVSNAENSLLLKLINKQKHTALNASACKRQPMPQTGIFISDADYACVQSWVKKVVESAEPPGGPVDPFAFEPGNAGMALAKAKYILHGGAPTSAELQSVGGSQGTLDPQALRNQILAWEATPEYQIKVKDFLALNLQQLPLGIPRYDAQFNSLFRPLISKIDPDQLRSNFEESFVRTAWQIVKGEEDFRKVVSTRSWYVTTAMLAALVYLEKPTQSLGRAYQQDPLPGDFFVELAYLEPGDYSDWRRVTLSQSDTPATWENSASFTYNLRSIAEGGSLALRYPRVGFFSSPVFLNTWETNDDNQFRLTTNQTLIVALNKSISPSDPTPHITENGIPPEHADKSSSCYQCHRHMDPMRLVFSNSLITRYRSRIPITTAASNPSFSFFGVTENFKTMDDFARILSTHPDLAKGWVQKLCVWGNSSHCDETDPEFIRLVDFFKASNYSMLRLIRQYFSSPIFTGVAAAKTHDTNEYIVSLSRGNHFCRAVEARMKQMNKAGGTTGSVALCTEGALGLVPADDYTRGQVGLVQATRVGWFDTKSIDGECARVAYGATASGTTSLLNLDAPIENNLAYLTEFLMGIPKNHHRYTSALDGLRRTYDLANKPANCANPLTQQGAVTCGYGMTKRDSLRAAWFAACTSPDLVSIGM